MANRHSYSFVKYKVESEGYRLLSEDYFNSLQKLELMCPKDHVFPMSFKVFQRGHRCSYCAGKRQYNIEEVRVFFEEKGYTLLSKEYKSNKDKLLVLGPDGEEYQTTLFAFKVSKILPHLKGKVYKNEEECRTIFERITNKKFPKTKPEWLVNTKTGRRLELDGYCEELQLAFEYDGKQHFFNTDFTKEKVETILERDLEKAKKCKEKGIRLIKIPFYIKDKNSYIKNKIQGNKHLYVGDPHVQIKNLKDCEKLIKFILKVAKKNEVSTIVFLGDLFHTHAVTRLEVYSFWQEAFKNIQKQYDIICLVGNHDMVLGESKYAGLNWVSTLDEEYKYNISIVDVPTEINGVGYVPYMDSQEKLIKASEELFNLGATKCLVAHQTFTGAQYENGFYAPDGVDPELVPQEEIISGHIHKTQQVGKCFYPGTPKWDSMSDANEDKGIWLFEHNEDGSVKSKEFISTKQIVTPIVSFTVKEGEELPELTENARNYVELIGKSSWIAQVKKKLKGRAQIKARPVDRKMVKLNRESRNIYDFLQSEFEPNHGVDKNSIKKYLTEVGI